MRSVYRSPLCYPLPQGDRSHPSHQSHPSPPSHQSHPLPIDWGSQVILRPVKRLATLAIVAAIAMGFVGCTPGDVFGYTVWVTNRSGFQRYVMFEGQGTDATPKTLAAPSDGLEYQSPQRTINPPPDGLGRVTVFDGSCLLLQSFDIKTLAHFRLVIDVASIAFGTYEGGGPAQAPLLPAASQTCH